MELVQIEMVGVEPFERPVQFGFGSLGVTLTRFACQEYFAPIGLQSIAQLDLGLSVPIRRGDVVIVDTSVVGRGDVRSAAGCSWPTTTMPPNPITDSSMPSL